MLGGSRGRRLGAGGDQRRSRCGLGSGSLNLLFRNRLRQRKTERWTEKRRCGTMQNDGVMRVRKQERLGTGGEKENSQDMFVASG